MSKDIRVVIDGEVWNPENNDTEDYDAIHTVAGAVLAGADRVVVERRKVGADWDHD